MADMLAGIMATCEEQLAGGRDFVSLVFQPGCSWRGMGFGRGELLCEQRDGRRVYRFKASKVLATLKAEAAAQPTSKGSQPEAREHE